MPEAPTRTPTLTLHRLAVADMFVTAIEVLASPVPESSRTKLQSVLALNLGYDDCLSVLEHPITLVNIVGVADILQLSIAEFGVETMAVYPSTKTPKVVETDVQLSRWWTSGSMSDPITW